MPSANAPQTELFKEFHCPKTGGKFLGCFSGLSLWLELGKQICVACSRVQEFWPATFRHPASTGRCSQGGEQLPGMPRSCCILPAASCTLTQVNFAVILRSCPTCRLHVRQSSRAACQNRKRWITRAEVISAEEEASLWKPRYNKYL